MALLADVTGRIPVVRDEPATPPEPEADLGETMAAWEAEMDGALGVIRSAMDGNRPAAAPAPALAAPTPTPAPARAGRRSARRDPEAAVLDEQIGELCDAIAELVGAEAPAPVWSDDPREATSPTGELLGGCGVDDATGIRTLLWHLRRTGLDRVEGLLPFVDTLSGREGFEVQAARFEAAVAAGRLGSDPEGGAPWVGRLWPIADRSGYGYAVHYRRGPRAGAVWAYGGDEPLHLLWDSVVDMLVELYQALTAGSPCDAAIAAVADGRVVWTNLG